MRRVLILLVVLATLLGVGCQKLCLNFCQRSMVQPLYSIMKMQ